MASERTLLNNAITYSEPLRSMFDGDLGGWRGPLRNSLLRYHPGSSFLPLSAEVVTARCAAPSSP